MFSLTTNGICLLLLLTLRTSYIANALIIPEELPSLLSVVYSNIPPIKKGIDSRVGLGFRLGDHADFQVLFEVGPQTSTQTLGPEEAQRRRHVKVETMTYKRNASNMNKPEEDESTSKSETEGSRWLNKWRKSISKS